MTGNAVVQRVAEHRWRPTSGWSVLRIALIVLWVAWAALSWWHTPREATVAQARADLAAGRVTQLEWGDSWRNNGWGWIRPPELWSDGDHGPLFAWRTPDQRVHYAMLDAVPRSATSFPATSDTNQGPSYTGLEAASLGQAVTSAGLDPVGPGIGTTAPPLTLVAVLLGLATLVGLLSGPAPVTGTRWFWWWLVWGVPFGLGLLYWLARERPWSTTAQPPPGPLGRDPRRRWYLGIATSIVTGILGSLLVGGLNRLLGDGLVPRLPG